MSSALAATASALEATMSCAAGASSGSASSQNKISSAQNTGDLVVARLDRGGGGGVVVVTQYRDESQIPDIMALMSADLSEPYSIFTYRYFLAGWPKYCLLVSRP
jgi:hypothetical protein